MLTLYCEKFLKMNKLEISQTDEEVKFHNQTI